MKVQTVRNSRDSTTLINRINEFKADLLEEGNELDKNSIILLMEYWSGQLLGTQYTAKQIVNNMFKDGFKIVRNA